MWRLKLELGNALPDKLGVLHFSWDPPCSYVIHIFFTDHLDSSIRFSSLFNVGNLVGQLSQQCLVRSQDL